MQQPLLNTNSKSVFPIQNLLSDSRPEVQFRHVGPAVVASRRGRCAVTIRYLLTVQAKAEYVVADETRAALPSFQTCATDATKLNVNANNSNGGTAKRLGLASVV